MNNVVLGGAQFEQLSQRNLNRLLDYAVSVGIRTIDTAPMYSSSENLIGNYSRRSAFSINTKCGMPAHPSLFKGKYLKNQIIESLRKLKVDFIETLFVHSIPSEYLTSESLEVLNTFKTNGYVKFIGYSGHGADLKNESKNLVFEKYMFTFNALDITDRQSFGVNNSDLFIKRPLANGVFNDAILTILKRHIRTAVHKKRTHGVNSYEFRFSKMKKFIDNDISHLEYFLKFLQYYYPDSKCVIGTSSIKHLNQIVAVMDKHFDKDLRFENYFTELSRMSINYKWQALP
jgi:aryl-alcohol dehydrogenase-like predicted oxidoreductase